MTKKIMTKKIILTKGLPASGKSTWACQYCLDNPNSINICKDDIRLILGKKKEKEVLAERDRRTIKFLTTNTGIDTVIWSDTNFNPIHEKRAREIALEIGDTEVVINNSFLEVPLEKCIKRDLIRPNSVGERVIKEMYYKYVKPHTEYIEDKNLPHIVMVDIDGTVAKLGNRSPYDWSKVGIDIPNEHVCNIVSSLLLNNNRIIFVSGRDEVCREETEKWIRDNFEEYYHTNRPLTIFMRPKGDTRKDTEIKLEIFENEIKGKYYVDMVIDDRPQVIRLWLSLGLPVVAVGNPYLEF